jgi:hypothetical protein
VEHEKYDSLSPEKIQLFLAGLSGLAPEEVRNAKLLYVRTMISDFQAMQSDFQEFGEDHGCMSIIPSFFWQFIWGQKGVRAWEQKRQKRVMASALKLCRDRIRNTIDEWREDLKGERFLVDGEEIIA